MLAVLKFAHCCISYPFNDDSGFRHWSRYFFVLKLFKRWLRTGGTELTYFSIFSASFFILRGVWLMIDIFPEIRRHRRKSNNQKRWKFLSLYRRLERISGERITTCSYKSRHSNGGYSDAVGNSVTLKVAAQ